MHACAWMCERGDGFIGKNVRKMKFQQQQQQQQYHVTIEKTTSRVEKGIELLRLENFVCLGVFSLHAKRYVLN